MVQRTLNEWLEWQQQLHPKEIDLGLERVRSVAQTLSLLTPAFQVVTLAGTNGKGSSAAMLESILVSAGFNIGSFTSPHLHHYTERVKFSGVPCTEQQLCEAFFAIDVARGTTSLTYFEWSALAALWLFKQQGVDLAILEVGLGGRLDAVNILDADVMLVTSIGIDHTEWLGDTREKISLEKLGIGRAGATMVCSDPHLPDIFIETAEARGVKLYRLGHDFSYESFEQDWSWNSALFNVENISFPGLPGKHQLQNASGVIAVLEFIKGIAPDSPEVSSGLVGVRLEGRYEVAKSDPRIVLDVAHNIDSVRCLRESLRSDTVEGETWCLIGVLNDKDIKNMIALLDAEVDRWIISSPLSLRALPTAELEAVVLEAVDIVASSVQSFESLEEGFAYVEQAMRPKDRLVVTGSFYTVSQVRVLLTPIGEGT